MSAQMPAHVRDQHRARAAIRDLGFEVVEVEHQILGHLDQHGPRAHRRDRAPGTGASVKALVSTASPCLIPTARSAICIAAPPEAQARQWGRALPGRELRARTAAAWLSSPGAVL